MWRLTIKYSPDQPREPSGMPTGGRWVATSLRTGGNVSEYFKVQREQVGVLIDEYFEKRGLGPCGPCAAVAVEQLRRAGYDARPAVCLYKYGKSGSLGGHYVAVVMDNAKKPWFVVDNSNFFQDDARVMVTRGDRQWRRFVDLQWGSSTESMQQFADVLWSQEDFDWWKSRL